jgi:anaerobic magnesium-protoporphyrin IX monomethyl ester cyclase
MEVLFIQSYLGPSPEILTYPLGLAYIATAAHLCGHDVRIIDPNTEAEPLVNLRRTLLARPPECIGLSLRNIDNQNRLHLSYHYKHFQDTLACIHDALPDVPIVVGGTGFSMFAQEIMERNPSISYGAYLEAEESFPELLANLDDPGSVKGIFIRADGNVIFTGDRPLPDFANLPHPRRDFVNMEPYLRVPQSFGLQTKRGCPLRCAYCNYPHLNGTTHRLRSAKSVVDELEYLVNECGVMDITFADSVLNVPTKHAESIFTEIIQRGIPISWGCYMHMKGITPDFVRLAMQAGCKAMLFSPDGISQAALDGLEKGLSEQEVAGVFDMFRSKPEFGSLHIGFCYFICPPGETFSGLLKALSFYSRVHLSRLKRTGARMRAYVGWIRLEPHTKVHETAIREGTILKNQDLLPNKASGLKTLFYRHPRLEWINRILLVAFGLIQTVENVAIRILKGRKAS